MKLLVGRGSRGGRELFLCRVAWFVSGGLVEIGESVAEPVTEIRGAAVLLLEDGIFDDGSPDGAVLVVASFERAVLLLSEGTTFLTTRLLEDGRSVREGRADFRGEVGLGVRVVLLVRVWKVCAEAGLGVGKVVNEGENRDCTCRRH